MDKWKSAQRWEGLWWANCSNTFGEEMKQLLYAQKMGLVQAPDANTPFRFDLKGISVLDVGGGPCSLLLKCVNVRGKVIDPLKFPNWVERRYKAAGIGYERTKAEDMRERGWDEAWVYNVIQHSDNPQVVIRKMRLAAKVIRIFEWIGTPMNVGHPHTLTEARLNRWLKGEGKIEEIRGQNNCWGQAYYGVFVGKEV